MAKVRLYGETSGYVDLKAPDVANDVTITLPNESGPFATEAYADAASGLVAVKHVLKTDTQVSSSIAAGASVAVSGLALTHEVADAANRLIITAFFGAAATSAGNGGVGIAVDDGAGLIALGASAGSRTRVTAGGAVSPTTGTVVLTMPSVTFVHTPGEGSKTYTVHAINIRTAASDLYINRSQDDSDAGFAPRAASALVIQEVKV